MATRPLSELEGCVLGHLFKNGPATAYSIRQAFLVSQSSHWSGSAGAVYPLLARLEKRGLVESREATRGRREAWSYSLSRSGRERFLAWLKPPFAPEVVSVPPDPLRTRVHFLGALPLARRAEFFGKAIDDLRRILETLESGVNDDDDDRRAIEGAALATRARIEWLETLRRQVKGIARRS